MNKQISVYDAFTECLHIIGDVKPSDRYKVIAALHRLNETTEGGRVLGSQPLTIPESFTCVYEDCTVDAEVIVGSTPFCHYHAADGILANMAAGERAHLVSIHVSSDELIDVEGLPQ